MLPSLIIFSLALLALIMLFGLKLIELRGTHVTVLARLRSVGDPLIEEGFRGYAQLCRARVKNTLAACAAKARDVHRRTEVFTLAHTQKAASRLHDFLMQRRVEVEGKTEHVSLHLKTVLEKETTPPAESK